MKRQFIFFYSVCVLLLSVLTGCVNLKQVNDYSSASSAGINKFEDIDYSFQKHCIDACQFEAIKTFDIRSDEECDCKIYKQADSVTQLIYNSVKGYFDGLTNLSGNNLTTYNFDALKKSLTTGTFGGVTLNEPDVAAYSKISNILLNAATNLYRKRELKKYIEEANNPLQILLGKFQFILQSNLEGELNWKKNELLRYYKGMKEDTLSGYEKGKATIDYYKQLSEVNTRKKQIDLFAKSIHVIADGHQKLYDNREKMSLKNLRELLIPYVSDIRDIISEFNKLNK